MKTGNICRTTCRPSFTITTVIIEGRFDVAYGVRAKVGQPSKVKPSVIIGMH